MNVLKFGDTIFGRFSGFKKAAGLIKKELMDGNCVAALCARRRISRHDEIPVHTGKPRLAVEPPVCLYRQWATPRCPQPRRKKTLRATHSA